MEKSSLMIILHLLYEHRIQYFILIYSLAAQNFLSLKCTSPTSDDNKIANLNADEDEGYFGCYSHFSIHQEMLQVNKIVLTKVRPVPMFIFKN